MNQYTFQSPKVGKTDKTYVKLVGKTDKTSIFSVGKTYIVREYAKKHFENFKFSRYKHSFIWLKESYKRHNALSNIMNGTNYNLKQAIVFCNDNVQVRENIFYCPVYMAGFLESEDTSVLDYKYTLDIDVLK